MAGQKFDQETQLGPSDAYDDTKSSGVALETSAENVRDDLNALRSQLKRFLHGNDAGNWWDNPVTVFSANATLKALLAAAGNGGLAWTAEKTANYTAVVGDYVLCNPSGGAFQVDAPASPSDNDKFGAKKHDDSANAITVDGNGKNFDGGAGTRTLSDANEWRVWKFSSTADEWLEVGG